MANPFVHMELNTPDLAKAKAFYGEIFGWTFDDMDVGGEMIYSMFKPEAGPGGGMMSMADAPPMWLAYIGVEDIHAATEKAKAAGAQVMHGPQEVSGKGAFTLLKDPTGVAIAMWQDVEAS